MADSSKSYELKADSLSMPVNKPGEPFKVKDYSKGDKVTGLSEDRARELIEAGALVDPDAKDTTDDGKPGESKPPKRRSRGRQAQPEDAEPAGSGTTDGGTAGAGNSGSATPGQPAQGGTPTA